MSAAQSRQYDEFEFDFAVSFAGPHRAIASEIAETLRAEGFTVFYDDSRPSRLLGARLDRQFKWVFGSGTRFFVPIVSHEYVDRSWPQFEWDVATREAKHRQYDFILPLRRDNTLLPGLPGTIGYIDLNELTPRQAAHVLCQKYEDVFGKLRVPFVQPTWIATFGLVIDEVTSSGDLPTSAPHDYPHLCDWLENDLMNRLQHAPISDPHFAEASARNGETLSVRVAFDWSPQQGALEFGALQWWETLEVMPYADIYADEI